MDICGPALCPLGGKTRQRRERGDCYFPPFSLVFLRFSLGFLYNIFFVILLVEFSDSTTPMWRSPPPIMSPCLGVDPDCARPSRAVSFLPCGKEVPPQSSLACREERPQCDQAGVRVALVEDPLLPGDFGLCPDCLLYTSPSPRDQRGSRMPSSA